VGSAEARNTGWLGLERVVQFLVAFAIGPVVARHLGPANYGLLAYAIAVTYLLTPLLTVGESLVIRDLAGEAAPAGVVLGAAAVLSAVTTGFAAALILGLGDVASSVVPAGGERVVVIVLLGAALKPVGVIDWWLQARLEARRAIFARTLALLLGACARIGAVLAGAALLTFAWLISAEAALATVFLVCAYRMAGGSLRSWRVDPAYMRSLGRQALPMVVAGLSVVLYMRIDQVMLGALSQSRQNALYAVAVNLTEVTWFLPVAVMTSLTPAMTRLWAADRERAAAQMERVYVGAAIGAYAVMVISALAGPWVITLLYGRQYNDVVPVFLLLTLTNVFVYLGVLQTIWTVNERRQGLALLRTGVAAILNIGLNFVLLPRYGARGAAVTTVVAYAVGGVAGNALSPRSWEVWRSQLGAMRLKGARAVFQGRPRLEGTP
jgi:PST family polysaccharide transporter